MTLLSLGHMLENYVSPEIPLPSAAAWAHLWLREVSKASYQTFLQKSRSHCASCAHQLETGLWTIFYTHGQRIKVMIPFISQTLTQPCPGGRWVGGQTINHGQVWADGAHLAAMSVYQLPPNLKLSISSTIIFYAEKCASGFSIHWHHLSFTLIFFYSYNL